MLLLKKKIVFITINKKSSNYFLQLKIIYYFIHKGIGLLLYISNCFLLKNNLVSNNLKYIYNLKWNSLSSYILAIKISLLMELFYIFIGFNSVRPILIFSKSKYLVSVLRSPFVYKKSMEQFFYQTSKIYYQTDLIQYNFFFQKYQYNFLKKELKENSIFKFFCQITFFFK